MQFVLRKHLLKESKMAKKAKRLADGFSWNGKTGDDGSFLARRSLVANFQYPFGVVKDWVRLNWTGSTGGVAAGEGFCVTRGVGGYFSQRHTSRVYTRSMREGSTRDV
jgi:hypothetical protein